MFGEPLGVESHCIGVARCESVVRQSTIHSVVFIGRSRNVQHISVGEIIGFKNGEIEKSLVESLLLERFCGANDVFIDALLRDKMHGYDCSCEKHNHSDIAVENR